jgi:hypothetical protein
MNHKLPGCGLPGTCRNRAVSFIPYFLDVREVLTVYPGAPLLERRRARRQSSRNVSCRGEAASYRSIKSRMLERDVAHLQIAPATQLPGDIG